MDQRIARSPFLLARVFAASAPPEGRSRPGNASDCLLYTSDAADERSSVDLGGRRIIQKKTKKKNDSTALQHK